MVKAIIGIGIPKSGKTALLKQLAEEEQCYYICANDIRNQLLHTDFSRPLNELVWDEVYRIDLNELSNGRKIIIDATNARVSDRQELAVHCRSIAPRATIIGVWFNTPLHVCLQRNHQSGQRAIPVSAMHQMAEELDKYPPSHRDGFDEILKVVA